MVTWIFQANPEKFRINEALLDPEIQERCTWLAEQHGSELASGQEAFIYRTGSPNNAIIARATILGEYREMLPAPHVYEYWTEESKEDESLKRRRPRIFIKIEEIAPDLIGIPYSKLKISKIPVGLQGQTNIKIKYSKEVDIIRKKWSDLNPQSV
tara:strand:- start:764 stop:1228 length:465 start_codon:yes stop_codon:yes gene_type:complete